VALPVVGGRPLPRAYQAVQRPLPGAVRTVEVSWTCGKPRSRLEVRRGIPASVALFPPGDTARVGRRRVIYFSPDIPLTSRSNPVHRYLYRDRGARERRKCRPRRIAGRIGGVTNTGVLSVGSWRISVAAGTRLLTPEVDGVPRLRPGMRITVDALDCPGRVQLVGRTISGG
jgi:hypothetical protein